MPSFRIAAAARRDLLHIYDFSSDTFGKYQADAYFAGLDRAFSLIADFPRIGTRVDVLRTGYRRFRFQSHYIFYTEEADHIVIRKLLHVRQNPHAKLFE